MTRECDKKWSRKALEGLSVGDALGERFFGPALEVLKRIDARLLPPGPWSWTDDTQMALSIVDILDTHGQIDQDALALAFANRFDIRRGYGGGAQQLLEGIRAGGDWLWLSKGLFDGGGSYGNGAAMRVAPLGAYFAADLDLVVQQADASAVVTHSHPEGRAGAIAVALAAAMARRLAGQSGDRAGLLFDEVLRRAPASQTRSGIAQVSEMAAEVHPGKVAELVGSGQQVSAQDTVPFVIWCAAHHLDDYEEAFWATLSGLGDRDTTCAMVGGIVAAHGSQAPQAWVERREALPGELP